MTFEEWNALGGGMVPYSFSTPFPSPYSSGMTSEARMPPELLKYLPQEETAAVPPMPMAAPPAPRMPHVPRVPPTAPPMPTMPGMRASAPPPGMPSLPPPRQPDLASVGGMAPPRAPDLGRAYNAGYGNVNTPAPRTALPAARPGGVSVPRPMRPNPPPSPRPASGGGRTEQLAKRFPRAAATLQRINMERRRRNAGQAQPSRTRRGIGGPMGRAA